MLLPVRGSCMREETRFLLVSRNNNPVRCGAGRECRTIVGGREVAVRREMEREGFAGLRTGLSGVKEGN